mmetsp:Transcript_115073/g.332439  ORF Transcript_115073/g.332439 Transcript_115073/m.332439 type:complete len:208 (-) Transcript_115073:242-865(-)
MVRRRLLPEPGAQWRLPQRLAQRRGRDQGRSGLGGPRPPVRHRWPVEGPLPAHPAAARLRGRRQQGRYRWRGRDHRGAGLGDGPSHRPRDGPLPQIREARFLGPEPCEHAAALPTGVFQRWHELRALPGGGLGAQGVDLLRVGVAGAGRLERRLFLVRHVRQLGCEDRDPLAVPQACALHRGCRHAEVAVLAMEQLEGSLPGALPLA